MENAIPYHPKAKSLSYIPFLAPVKLFRCKYCARKFLNSRALGGHQNAHKKEKTLWMMGFSNHKSSMGMVPHAVQDKPTKAKESFKRFQEALRQQMFVEAADQGYLRWPGSSFRVKSSEEDSGHGEILKLELATDLVLSSQQDQSKICGLDLDLRL